MPPDLAAGLDQAGRPDDAALARDELDRAVAALGPPGGPEREVWRLLHVEDRPVAEVARLIGIPEGTVKSRAHRARRLLRASSRPPSAPRSSLFLIWPSHLLQCGRALRDAHPERIIMNVEASELTRRFGRTWAVAGVELRTGPGVSGCSARTGPARPHCCG
ncbi:MAG: sigma factor-like helix-turn-helix DNA-binding protein [Actinomycetota bacterium]